MKIFVIAVLGILVPGSLASGQNATPSARVAPQGPPSGAPPADTAQPAAKERIAPGSVIPVQLIKTIDAKKAKPGEEVDAQVTEDLKSAGGVVIVPKNTKIVGKVIEAQPRNKQEKESQVAIAFDHMIRDGNNVSMPMSIQAIIAPSYLSGGNGNNGNGQGASQAPSSPASGGGTSPEQGGRSPGTSAPQSSNPSASSGEEPGTNATNSTAHPPITGNTKGVLGMQNMSLSTAASPAQGSLVTSEKSNVKLEGGTLMLLRVNQ